MIPTINRNQFGHLTTQTTLHLINCGFELAEHLGGFVKRIYQDKSYHHYLLIPTENIKGDTHDVQMKIGW